MTHECVDRGPDFSIKDVVGLGADAAYQWIDAGPVDTRIGWK